MRQNDDAQWAACYHHLTENRGESTMNITILGIDLAKNVFQLHGVDSTGKTILRKKLNRDKLLEYIANLPVCRIVMEACGSANYWARKFKAHGHEVKLISPQFVKPFVKGNKNDRNDSAAIVEAASRPSMRYVSPKTIEQQDMQSLLRVREGCIEMRTKVVNQVRGLLAEYGIVVAQGIHHIKKALPEHFDAAKENGLTEFFKQLLEKQYNFILVLDEQIDSYEIKISHIANQNVICQQVKKVEGIGDITALALTATIGEHPEEFKNGRHFAAFLGLVPKQHSSGSREQLLGISKRGDGYLRKLLIHGARSVLYRADKKSDAKSRWLINLKERRGENRACVALANKNARIVLALLLKKQKYKPELSCHSV
jgi:transposase